MSGPGGWGWVWLVALGAFHGINPAMGWLFAVARGLQQRSRRAVLGALLPIGLGHALSIAFVVAVLGGLGVLVDPRTLQIGVALLLFTLAGYRLVARHRARGGMQVGPGALTLWSFLMATGHGAGLMLMPVLLATPPATGPAGAASAGSAGLGHAAGLALGAVTVHTLAMLAVAAGTALAVYDWVGLAFLRRGWINLDWVWALALIVAGALVLAGALVPSAPGHPHPPAPSARSGGDLDGAAREPGSGAGPAGYSSSSRRIMASVSA